MHRSARKKQQQHGQLDAGRDFLTRELPKQTDRDHQPKQHSPAGQPRVAKAFGPDTELREQQNRGRYHDQRHADDAETLQELAVVAEADTSGSNSGKRVSRARFMAVELPQRLRRLAPAQQPPENVE